MGMPEKKPDEKYSYADYLTWPEDERWEIINGAAYNMSPAPSRRHQEISREIERQIANFLIDKSCEVYDAPFDVRLPGLKTKDEEVFTVVQPDIVVVCDQKKLDKRGCIGTPDWIIEILSPETAVKDMREKLNLYEKHGVKEYWIIHPEESYVMVFTLTSKGYGKPKIVTVKEKISSAVLKELEIDLPLVFK